MVKRRLLFSVLIVMLATLPVTLASGQNLQQAPGAAVTQTAARSDVANLIATTVSSATTLTLTPANGESVYVYHVHITNCAGASAVTAAAVTTVTTTNIGGGTTPAWTVGSGTTAGACQPTISESYPTGLKGNSPGVAVTFVTPTFATNQSIRLQVAWRSAP